MSLIPYSRTRHPLDLFGGLSQLHRELDRFFDFGPRGMPAVPGLDLLEGAWSPAVDVFDEKDAVRVKAELPGLKQKEIEVSVQGNTLLLKGERARDFDEKGENYHRVERVYGQFHRAIGLPAPVDASAVKATYKDGILEVLLPKKPEAKARRIEVDCK
jgi:HSP20 family protein